MLETPRLEWIFAHNAFYDFFYEHCNYFTKQSLEILCYRAGFEVLETIQSFKNQYQIIVLQKAKQPKLSNISLKNYANIAIWGAGAKGVTLANELNAVCVIDINKNKQNCFIPKCGIEILSLESALKTHKIDLILVMNPNYKDEIKALCKQHKDSATIPIKCVNDFV